MKRPRYPSDDARLKQRPHAKIHLSCRSHPRYGEVFADLETRAIVWSLWLVAMQYQAARTEDEVTLTLGDIIWITGREKRVTAMSRLARACVDMGYTMVSNGRSVTVRIRNLKRKQGLDSAYGGATTRTPDPSDSDSDSDSDSEKKRMKEDLHTLSTSSTPPAEPKVQLPLLELEAAFSAYGRQIRKWPEPRKKLLRARLRDADGELAALATAVHGYVWLHRQPSNGFDPMEHLTPETIFRPSNFAKYLDAGLDALQQGEMPPYRIEPKAAPRRLTQNEETKLELLRRRQRDGVRLPGDPPLPDRAQPAIRTLPTLGSGVAADGLRDDRRLLRGDRD